MEKIKNILKISENWKKVFVILVGIYVIAISALIREDYDYIDDMGRAAYGYTGWEERFSRYLSTFLSHMIHAGTFLSDISPFPQLLAIIILAISSVLIIKILVGEDEKCSLWEIIAVIPVGLSPYFLECISYKYDSPYMAISIFASVFPILFYQCGMIQYYVSVIIGTIAVCTTYQAGAGIFPMIIVVIALEHWNKGKKINEVIKYIFQSAVPYLIGMGIYKFFIMKTVTSYVENGIAAPREILQHYIQYFTIVKSDFKTVWCYCIAIICIGFIIEKVYTSKQNKILSLILSSSAVFVMGILSWGLYPALKQPLMAPRAMYGFGVFIALLGVATVKNKSKYFYVLKLVCVVLSWCFIVLALTYGNALVAQEEYTDMRMNAVVMDLNTLDCMKKDTEKNIQIKGSIGQAPIIRNKPQNNQILNRLIPITFRENWYWGNYKLCNYYGIQNLKPVKEIDLAKKNLPILKDTMYHTIYGNSKNILIELK